MATAYRKASQPAAPAKPLPLLGVPVGSVPTRKVEWLWPGRIPIGKLTLLDGNPGLGKSLLTVDCAARISTGRAFYGSAAPTVEGPGSVLIVTNEDDVGDTIRPRLEAHGGDIALVRHERDLSLPSDMGRLVDLAKHMRETDAPLRLCILDPLPAVVDEDVDVNSAASIKRVLTPLAIFAAGFSLAVLIIRHFAKRGDGPAVTKGSGNIAIIGQARSGMLIAADPDDASARILSMTKTNLCRNPGSLRYRIADDEHGRSVVQWIGSSDVDAEELVQPKRRGRGKSGNGASGAAADSKLGQCVEWLLKQFQRAPGRRLLAADVFTDAARADYSEMTVKRAKARLPISTRAARTDAGHIAGHVWTLETELNLDPKTPSEKSHRVNGRNGQGGENK